VQLLDRNAIRPAGFDVVMRVGGGAAARAGAPPAPLTFANKNFRNQVGGGVTTTGGTQHFGLGEALRFKPRASQCHWGQQRALLALHWSTRVEC
jgi:hypothetical protein